MENLIRLQKSLKTIAYYKYLYILLIPGMLYYIIFSYLPMYGATLAFKHYSFKAGILGSDWTGLANYERLFSDIRVWRVVKNTIFISFARILFEFPIPVIFSILINEIRKTAFKRTIQTVLTFPHFLSWVVVSGIIINLFADSGIVNQVIVLFGGEKSSLLMDSKTFIPILFISNIWKELGWNTIIYLAAITSINPELFESAIVDGARKHHLMLYITWPCIRPVVGVMLILAVANIMNAGFDQILNMYNAVVRDTVDIIDTYIYRRTFLGEGMDYGLSTAFGLFKSVINFIMLFIANATVKKLGSSGIF